MKASNMVNINAFSRKWTLSTSPSRDSSIFPLRITWGRIVFMWNLSGQTKKLTLNLHKYNFRKQRLCTERLSSSDTKFHINPYTQWGSAGRRWGLMCWYLQEVSSLSQDLGQISRTEQAKGSGVHWSGNYQGTSEDDVKTFPKLIRFNSNWR